MSAEDPKLFEAVEVRVRGRVQGVGFRPKIWHMARELGLAGEVLNDSDGVLVRIGGDRVRLAAFLDGIESELPPLARVESVEKRSYAGRLSAKFRISESSRGGARTQIAPDAAICAACSAELRTRGDRHYRYPFTSCTHCGPRLSIVTAIPYDRMTTTMASFALCPDCRSEYANPHNRRFHAEAIACPSCGPLAKLIALRGAPFHDGPAYDHIQRASALIRDGEIVAVKGIGGYHLACDATNASAVTQLRRLKRRSAKPFALMARDLDVIRRYCTVTPEEERQLTGAQAPIVLLQADGLRHLPEGVAPGLDTLGFMLPTTPLHLLLLQDLDWPLVMTSGNISDEPPIIDDARARDRLADVATHALVHDRRIANQVDDSVVRVIDGKPRVLRRARGFAPSPIKLPAGFEASPELLAMGGELKATFCLLKDGQAILSQHQGDLENVATFDNYQKHLALYRQIFAHSPAALVVDRHPEYLSSKLGRAESGKHRLPLVEVQHHHAHIAACLAENKYPLDGPPVLGIVLDGLGFGDDGTIWGGELLLADYRDYRRLARLKPVPMLGGAQAIRQPWRSLYAHLMTGIGWDELTANFSGLDLYADLRGRPRAMLDAMILKHLNSPLASSCGRLFDAVAAALGIRSKQQLYEGEAATRLEALAASELSADGTAATGYPFAVSSLANGLMEVDPAPMWTALLRDLAHDVPASAIALRFHQGLSSIIVETAHRLAHQKNGAREFEAVALSGGCFQNRILFESVAAQLRCNGLTVLAHAEVPANDGGLSLGQAAVAAALLLESRHGLKERTGQCASVSQGASSK